MKRSQCLISELPCARHSVRKHPSKRRKTLKLAVVKKTMKIGRSAITGRFAPVKRARAYPSTYVVETIKPVKRK